MYGQSKLLRSIADRIGNVVYEGKGNRSVNVVPDSTVNVSPYTTVNVVPASTVNVPVAKNATLLSMMDWMGANVRLEVIKVTSNSCNESYFVKLDVCRFTNLKQLQVGDNCFENVKEVVMIGLHALEKVVIGRRSFRKNNDTDRSGRFYLKDCERLTELKIANISFEFFSVCEIERVPRLESIVMGDALFYHASLELRSDDDGKK